MKYSHEEIEQRLKSKQIDRILDNDRRSIQKQIKLLLLGAGESGKSTFLKQMRIIHGVKFDSDSMQQYQLHIYYNIIIGNYQLDPIARFNIYYHSWEKLFFNLLKSHSV